MFHLFSLVNHHEFSRALKKQLLSNKNVLWDFRKIPGNRILPQNKPWRVNKTSFTQLLTSAVTIKPDKKNDKWKASAAIQPNNCTKWHQAQLTVKRKMTRCSMTSNQAETWRGQERRSALWVMREMRWILTLLERVQPSESHIKAVIYWLCQEQLLHGDNRAHRSLLGGRRLSAYKTTRITPSTIYLRALTQTRAFFLGDDGYSVLPNDLEEGSRWPWITLTQPLFHFSVLNWKWNFCFH